MESNKSYSSLLELGFIPEQIERLDQLRYAYDEKEQVQVMAERRRLEFVRWLVSTGRLTDQLPEIRTG